MTYQDVITILLQNGYTCTSEYSVSSSRYRTFYNKNLNLTINLGLKFIELDGYPTSLNYTAERTARRLQALTDFILGKITDDNYDTNSLYDCD